MSKVGRGKDVEDVEILQILNSFEIPAVMTGDVAEKTTIGRDAMRIRLMDLADSGFVGTHKRGRCRIFWITDEGLDRLYELEE